MAYTTIDDPSVYFQTLLYTGNGGASRALTNDGNSDLQPDWLWIKKRNASRSHTLTDSSRGLNKYLEADDTGSEGTFTDKVISAQSDGFTVGDNSSVNANNDTYVAWQWKANGGTTTTNSAGANGADHESVYQADDTAGFSIVTYTSDAQSGDTIIKHGLSTAPTFMVHKSRSASSTIWWTYHKELTNDGYMHLESTNANQDGSTNVWRNTAPTSSVFKVGLDSIANEDGRTMVAYCFAPIKGYSKFGKYTGNGNADGPFIYLGFKPAWVMFKNTTSGHDWRILDNKRNTFNSNNTDLRPNTSAADSSGSDMDFLSNGIKMRDTDGDLNEDGSEHIYMAFAESPFVSSKGVPTTAR